MAHWDSTAGKIVHWETKPVENHPDWEWIDCGCCAGLQWGGELPRECPHCWATGVYARHKPTGTRALYPGGPLLGAHDEAAP